MTNFTHKYTKMDHPIFTTIRNMNYMAEHNLKVGDIDLIAISKTGNAMLIGYYDSLINELPLELLQYDMAPLECKSHDDFVKILISFVKFPSNKANLILDVDLMLDSYKNEALKTLQHDGDTFEEFAFKKSKNCLMISI